MIYRDRQSSIAELQVSESEACHDTSKNSPAARSYCLIVPCHAPSTPLLDMDAKMPRLSCNFTYSIGFISLSCFKQLINDETRRRQQKGKTAAGLVLDERNLSVVIDVMSRTITALVETFIFIILLLVVYSHRDRGEILSCSDDFFGVV